MIVLYCCDISEAKDVSAARHGAGRSEPRTRCYSTYEDSVRSRNSSSCVVAKATNTKSKIGEMPPKSAILGGRGYFTKTREV